MKFIDKKRKTADIKKEALKQLRETRGIINAQYPDLLDTMRGVVNKIQEHENHPGLRTPDETMVKIDQQKNMETILKFIELKPHSDGLKQELKRILS